MYYDNDEHILSEVRSFPVLGDPYFSSIGTLSLRCPFPSNSVLLWHRVSVRRPPLEEPALASFRAKLDQPPVFIANETVRCSFASIHCWLYWQLFINGYTNVGGFSGLLFADLQTAAKAATIPPICVHCYHGKQTWTSCGVDRVSSLDWGPALFHIWHRADIYCGFADATAHRLYSGWAGHGDRVALLELCSSHGKRWLDSVVW